MLTLNVVQHLNVHTAVAVTRQIPATSLTDIWVSVGTRGKEGAAIGAVVAAGAAAVLLTLFQGGGDEPECDGACRIQGTAIAAGIGAAAGATIGAFFIRWRLVF